MSAMKSCFQMAERRGGKPKVNFAYVLPFIFNYILGIINTPDAAQFNGNYSHALTVSHLIFRKTE